MTSLRSCGVVTQLLAIGAILAPRRGVRCHRTLKCGH